MIPGLVSPELLSVAAARAADSERACRLTPDVVAAMAADDLFRICVPRALGGREASPAQALGAIEALAEADGSAGWCLMAAMVSGLVSGRLAPEAAAPIFGDPATAVGGVLAPHGRAGAAAGERYIVTGRWPFASGVAHSGFMLAGCVVIDGNRPRMLPGGGAPDVHVMVLAREQLTIEETWAVAGLRGTGSHDMVAGGAAVASERSVSLFTGAPTADGPLYAFPVFGLLAAGVGAVGLGIARGALAAFGSLASTQKPALGRRLLAEHADAQASAARAWGQLRSARAFLREAIEEAWAEADEERVVSLRRRAALRVAATGAAEQSAAVVAALRRAAGGSAIYESSPLERRFRDAETVTAHSIVGPRTWELAGRVLLGTDVDPAML